MGADSKIEWTDHTFNPWWGCTKVSPGCDHCYAEALAKRYRYDVWGEGKERRAMSRHHWQEPFKWNERARKAGRIDRVFCASMADVFDNGAPEHFRTALWQMIANTPHLAWLLLTQRIGNARKMLPLEWGDGWPNVWIGISVVNQDEADRDIPKLLAVPARVRFLSCEPLLGPLWLSPHLEAGVPTRPDWVIVGGESGPGARPMHPDWARSIREQCQAAGVPFFFKQWGEWAPISAGFVNDDMQRIGKKRAGRLLDGREWNEFPQVTQHQQMKQPCEICRGSRTITLPIFRPMPMTVSDEREIVPTSEPRARTYPCPECGHSVPLERVAVLDVHSQVSTEIDDPGFIEHARKHTAHLLVDELLAADIVRFQSGAPNRFEGTRALRASIGVVAPRVVATMEQRAAAENERFAREVIARAATKIKHWGSHYTNDDGPISKAQAVSMLYEALREQVRPDQQVKDGD